MYNLSIYFERVLVLALIFYFIKIFLERGTHILYVGSEFFEMKYFELNC